MCYSSKLPHHKRNNKDIVYHVRATRSSMWSDINELLQVLTTQMPHTMRTPVYNMLPHYTTPICTHSYIHTVC